VTVDDHLEPVAARVDRSPGCGSVGHSEGILFGGFALTGSHPPGQVRLVLPVGDQKALQLGQLGVDAGLLHDEGVAGCEGFDFGVGERLLADVVDAAICDLTSHDLVDEGGFALDGLPSPYLKICQAIPLRALRLLFLRVRAIAYLVADPLGWRCPRG
jgi:hypothetical protein